MHQQKKKKKKNQPLALLLPLHRPLAHRRIGSSSFARMITRGIASVRGARAVPPTTTIAQQPPAGPPSPHPRRDQVPAMQAGRGSAEPQSSSALFFDSEALSDIQLVIRRGSPSSSVSVSAPAASRKRTTRGGSAADVPPPPAFAALPSDACLSCHGVFLACASPMWHYELQSWSDRAPRDAKNRKVRAQVGPYIAGAYRKGIRCCCYRVALGL